MCNRANVQSGCPCIICQHAQVICYEPYELAYLAAQVAVIIQSVADTSQERAYSNKELPSHTIRNLYIQ